MAPWRGTAARGVRRRVSGRVVVAAVSELAGVALAAVLAVCWRVAGAITRPQPDPPFELKVLAAGPGTVTLSATADVCRPGAFGLAWRREAQGPVQHGVLGPVVHSDGGGVTRELAACPPGSEALPAPGGRARLLASVWASDPHAALGLAYREVTYPSPLGPMPAWLVPGTRDTWVIQVHGYNSTRPVGLRVMPALHALGYPVLDICYRNDAGAPPSGDHRLHLGDTEWQDLEAAAAYAAAEGAAAVVLYGWSMGGGIVENYLQRGRQPVAVKGVILDAPALDWRAIIRLHAAGRRLPSFVASVQAAALARRCGIDLGRIDMCAANRRAGGPRQPVLLFHGGQDDVVPFATSAAFAREWPDAVTWVPAAEAGHTQSWNVGPQRYDAALTAFLNRVDPPAEG